MKFGSMCGISTASIMTSRIQKTLQSKYFKFYSLSQTDVRTITILHLSTLIIKNGKFADKEVESSTVVPGFSWQIDSFDIDWRAQKKHLISTTIHAAIKMKFGSMWDKSKAPIMTSRLHKALGSKYFKVYNLSQSDVRTITSLHLSTLMIKNGTWKIESSIYSLSKAFK